MALTFWSTKWKKKLTQMTGVLWDFGLKGRSVLKNLQQSKTLNSLRSLRKGGQTASTKEPPSLRSLWSENRSVVDNHAFMKDPLLLS